MTTSEYNEVLERVERLPRADQHRLLTELAARVHAPPVLPASPWDTIANGRPFPAPPPVIGKPGANLMPFVGSIAPESLEAMARAIEETCEQIDPHDW